jgi:mono/diheme cytochrome c family protein
VKARTWILVVAIVGAGALGLWRFQAAGDEVYRDNAAETSRVRGWARAEGGAGPSVLPIRVPLADERELRKLEDVPGFHEYAMRCSSCHGLPDPAAYPASRWIGKVDEMREHIRRAGVMPPEESELQAARRFLRAASDSLRPK